MLSKNINLQTLVLLGVVMNQDKALEVKDGEQNSPKHKSFILLFFVFFLIRHDYCWGFNLYEQIAIVVAQTAPL